jgi:hypothetical protein
MAAELDAKGAVGQHWEGRRLRQGQLGRWRHKDIVYDVMCWPWPNCNGTYTEQTLNCWVFSTAGFERWITNNSLYFEAVASLLVIP